MAISDDDLIRQLESMPMVNSPDFREAVMGRIRHRVTPQPRAAVLQFRPRVVLALAWAAAVAVVVGLAVWRVPELRPHNTAATMAPADFTVSQQGDRWLVQANIKGEIEWDPTKLSKIDTLSDGTVVLARKPGATGLAEIRLRVAGGGVERTTIRVD